MPFLLHIGVYVHGRTTFHTCRRALEQVRMGKNKRTTEEISRFEGLVAAHEDVEVDVGLGKGGHVWVLCTQMLRVSGRKRREDVRPRRFCAPSAAAQARADRRCCAAVSTSYYPVSPPTAQNVINTVGHGNRKRTHRLQPVLDSAVGLDLLGDAPGSILECVV